MIMVKCIATNYPVSATTYNGHSTRFKTPAVWQESHEWGVVTMQTCTDVDFSTIKMWRSMEIKILILQRQQRTFSCLFTQNKKSYLIFIPLFQRIQCLYS